jgi:hypothetical protein
VALGGDSIERARLFITGRAHRNHMDGRNLLDYLASRKHAL